MLQSWLASHDAGYGPYLLKSYQPNHQMVLEANPDFFEPPKTKKIILNMIPSNETLLLDVMEGNATLFMRSDQVEAAWKIIMPILDTWQTRPPVDFPNYAPGSWGPEDAEALIARDGRNWVTLPHQE